MFCLNLMRIALELAKENKAYEGLATKFFQHYVYVGAAMKHMGNRNYQLWDEQDKFFYDVLRYADGSFHKFRVRSLVGLIPLYAIERLEEDWIKPFPEFQLEPILVFAEPARPRAALRHDGRARRQTHTRPRHRQRRTDAASVRAHLGPERVSLGVRLAQSLEVSRTAPVPLRRQVKWAMSRPSRSTCSKAATPTGAAPSGFRPPL